MTIRCIRALTLVALVAALSGCGQKTEQAVDTTSATSDSLLSASPIEPSQGELTPQTEFQPQPTQTEAPPTPAPSPTSTGKKPAPPKKKPSSGGGGTPAPAAPAGVTVPAGTALKISIDTPLTSESAQAGTEWTGTLKEALVIGSSAPFPAGATVHGVVTGAKAAEKGDRAVLVLAITGIESGGGIQSIRANADSLIAGSTRKRNIGAIAGGAATGALIGKAVGGSGKGAVIGGLIGGAATTAAVAGSKGFQVTLKEGTEMTFVVANDTKVKL